MKQWSKTQLRLPRGTRREIFHRGTKSDLGVIEQIFKNGDYALGRLKRAEELIQTYEKMIEVGKIPLIIDAGSNIGASVIWFSVTYPKSHIVGFEPDKKNFELLELNTKGLDVDLRQAAVGSADGLVDIIDPGEGEWGYQTSPNATGLVTMLSLNRMVINKQQEGYEPFIVKIDIEGSEEELFSCQTEWLDKFPLLIIELHDWLLPRKQTSISFLRAISSLNRDFVYFGENIFSIKN